jgi:LacI family transcriptional regulator
MILVTIYDIAKKLGTTHATVSRALRNDKKIAKKTRVRVIEAAREMNYKPNLLARGLSGGRTETLGVLWNLAWPQPSVEMARNLAVRAQKHGWVSYIADHLRTYDVILAILHDFTKRGVDAVALELYSDISIDKELEDVLKTFSAAVIVTPIQRDIDVDQIIQDRSHAVRSAADHFITTGRKKPNIIQIRVGNDIKTTAYLDELARLGIHVNHEDAINIGQDNAFGRHCYDLLEKRFGNKPFPFDCFFCTADEFAMGAISWLQSRGYRVPEDIAVVGFNNSEAGELFHPPLASICRKDNEVAESIERLLFRRLEHPDLPQQMEVVRMEFIHRHSAG